MTKFSAGFVGVVLLGFAGFGGGFALLYWSGDVCFEQEVPAERRSEAPKAPGQRAYFAPCRSSLSSSSDRKLKTRRLTRGPGKAHT